MKKNKTANLKHEKGFLIQDLAIALFIIMILVSVVGAIYISIFKIQAETRIDSAMAVHAIKILEDIDKISYDDVVNGMEDEYRKKFHIPSAMQLQIDVSKYEPIEQSEDLIKNVKVKIDYEFQGNQRSFVLENIKVKEK